MNVLIECICGKKYDVDPNLVKEFDCEGCARKLTTPGRELSVKLKVLRGQMVKGEPGMRDAVKGAAQIQDFHALPILIHGAESGVREAVNTSVSALAEFDGPGRDLLVEWVRGGRLSITRMVTAFREEDYDGGPAFICRLINDGILKENQITEAASYLGDSGSSEALNTLRTARSAYPNLGDILNSALLKLKDLDANAGSIPEEAKRIPGREQPDPAAEKKGCMGLLLWLLIPLAGIVWTVTS